MFDSLYRMRAHFPYTDFSAGKITLLSAIVGGCIVLGVGGLLLFEVNVPTARADDVVTSVTVLNTPPAWISNAQESTESSATTPTNSGSVLTWLATGDDSSGDAYYLLICKTSGAPTANSGAAPTCNGGVANQWAVSASTPDNTQASAATTTKETFPFNIESNDWYGWICDGNASLPRCNVTSTQGSGNTVSPFVINHPPVFASISNDTPANPGETVTWTSTAYDNDTQGSSDTVRLLVCKANDYASGVCGAGGTWATSTLAASNPATTTTMAIPTQDATYSAYVFIVDNHNHAATSTIHASNSSFVVSNVTPTISAATVSLEDITAPGNLELVTPQATSGPFKVKFTAVDNNSCLNASAGNELSSAIANIYRSAVTSASCDAVGEYDSNSCYVNASPYFSNHISCVQDGGSCSGATDTDATWTCSFSFWYNADPTDGSSAADTVYFAQNWLASVQIGDNNFATSTLVEGTTGNEMASFLAFNVSSTSVSFGSLEPGQSNDPLATTTDLMAIGNIGLDEDVYGDTMCPTWSAPDSCDTNGYQTASDILIGQQRVATSSVAYASSAAFSVTASTSPREVLIRIPKTSATTTPQTKNNYWGIAIPIGITTAGSYVGQNTITAKKSNPSYW